MLPLVGSPEQFQAGHRRPLANRLADRQQPFGGWEVAGLVGECQALARQPLLQISQTEPPPVDAEDSEQLGEADAVFHRHRITAVQHHRLAGGRQQQGQQRQQRRRAAAAVIGHPEAERPLAGGAQHRAVLAVAVEHAGQLQRRRPANAMGDQERPQLGIADRPQQHQIGGFAGLGAGQAGAGVFTAAHLGQQLPEAQHLRRQRRAAGGSGGAGALHGRNWYHLRQDSSTPAERVKVPIIRHAQPRCDLCPLCGGLFSSLCGDSRMIRPPA